MWTQLLLILAVLQVFLLLLSPLARLQWPLSWYYEKVYRPFLADPTRYRVKYYIVPVFYFSLYCYMLNLYRSELLPVIWGRLYFIELYFFQPLLLAAIPVSGLLTMFTRPEGCGGRDQGVAPSEGQWPYDGILYYPNTTCRSCHTVKWARSKHCSICRRCIQLADHHCIWFNTCIGRGNFFYFYVFLACHCLILTYAFARLFFFVVVADNKLTSTRSTLTLLMLTGTFALLVDLFTYWQMMLVKEGMTTNEQDKWFLIHEYMRDGKCVNVSCNGSTKKWFLESDEDGKFYSTNAYDHTAYTLTNYHIVKNASEIINMYDKGSFWENFKDMCR
ncbi:palmitoyltransferase SWF1 KNAG_0H03110 [Huiozyma naganishii CBS 8797]|uniref:Palmitoyltransferase n=1 Tax=Huiozyma naganishii (strain ATCC MYA-139 / BCRC 22969 / CBS 8797 / KCTC 17520 / NBRC 10181 / NCYC 3082 / Yp74L-3) TaxID=1071383 RepID=J7S9V0_HUIN7|nr:hypothetical protein KNAG_0H03110 [Kazachstania naganishii CBS 8797]CCK71726.1 hypothetical protein KNAG_0H03110 [Kazachstania naganishii CBS 8797]